MRTRLVTKTLKAMSSLVVVVALVMLLAPAARAQSADIVLHNAKVLTVDKSFTITQAIAITGNKITATGTDSGKTFVAEGLARALEHVDELFVCDAVAHARAGEPLDLREGAP